MKAYLKVFDPTFFKKLVRFQGQAKKEQKDGEMTEDELKQAENKIQELTDKSIEEVDKVLSNKENEILSI